MILRNPKFDKVLIEMATPFLLVNNASTERYDPDRAAAPHHEKETPGGNDRDNIGMVISPRMTP